MRTKTQIGTIAVALGLLAACGGGGGDDPEQAGSRTSTTERTDTTERSDTTEQEATTTMPATTTTAPPPTTTTPRSGYSGAPVRVDLDGWTYRFELMPQLHALVDLVQFEKNVASSPPGEARVEVTIREPEPFSVLEGTEIGMTQADTPGRNPPPIQTRAAYFWFDDERDWTDGLPKGHGCYYGPMELEGRMQSGLVCDLQSAYTETVDLPESVADALVAGTSEPPILVVGFTVDPIDQSSWGLCRVLFHTDGRVDYSATSYGTDCSTAPR